MAERKKPTLGSKLKQSKDLLFGTSDNLPRIIEVDLEHLRPNPDQPRQNFDEETLQGLADSINKHGLLQPIAVARDPDREDGYIIVAGERRYRAHQILRLDTVPAVVTSGKLDEISLIENVQREDLNPLEEAEALQKMMERHGYTQAELGKVVGKKQNTISELLKLTKLPQTIKEHYLTSGTVSKSALIELSRLKSKTEQLRFWDEIKDGGVTVRAARTKKVNKGSSKLEQNPPSPALSTLKAGRHFAKMLLSPELTPSSVDDLTYTELVELYRKIGEGIHKLTPKN